MLYATFFRRVGLVRKHQLLGEFVRLLHETVSCSQQQFPWLLELLFLIMHLFAARVQVTEEPISSTHFVNRFDAREKFRTISHTDV